MTELQMGLIGLGATAVVGVLGYNKWQEYRHRKLAEAVLKPQHDDVLLADAPAKVAPAVRSEPELRAEAPAAAGGTPGTGAGRRVDRRGGRASRRRANRRYASVPPSPMR